MPSVVVTWNGQCRDRAARTRLIASLEEFAAESHSHSEPSEILRFDGPLEGVSLLLAPSRVSESLTASRELREELARALEVRGGSLLAVAAEQRPAAAEAFIDQMKASFERALADFSEATSGESGESSSIDAARSSARQPNVVALPYTSEVEGVAEFNEATRWCIRLPDASLHGIQWRLHDPRNLYPGDDWMAFVHLEIPEVPLLDGCLFGISRTPCSTAQAAIGGADYYLDGPSIHLRYFLENWFDRFLGWVKYFHVADLEYFRYEYCPAWAGFEREMKYRLRYQAASRASLGEQTARDLLSSLREESQSWESFRKTGPERPVYMLDVELENEIEATRSTLSSAISCDRAELCASIIDGLLTRAGWLRDWRGRTEDYHDCIDEAGSHLEELLSLRRSGADLVRLARHRYQIATLPIASDSSEYEPDDEFAASDAADIAMRREALREGLDALLELDASERPTGLEARFRRRIGRLLFDQGDHSRALEELDRACELWDVTDQRKLDPSDIEEMAGAYLYLAGLLEQAGRAQEGEDRLRISLERLKEAHEGAQVSSVEAEGHEWLARQAGQRGDAVRQREHHVEALATYRALSRGADRYASRWLRDVAEQLLELADLDEKEGKPEDALSLLPEVVNLYPTTGLTWIARVELSRRRFSEAFDAALEALSILSEESYESHSDELHAEVCTQLRDAIRGMRERGDDLQSVFDSTVGPASETNLRSGLWYPERVVRILCVELGIASDGGEFSPDDLRELLSSFPERIESPRSRRRRSLTGVEADEAAPVRVGYNDRNDLSALESALSHLPAEARHDARAVIGEYPHLSTYLRGSEPS